MDTDSRIIPQVSYGNYTAIASFLSVAAANRLAPSQAEALYQLAILTNLQYALTDPGLTVWGLGQLLFGWLAWKSGLMPNWHSVLGFLLSLHLWLRRHSALYSPSSPSRSSLSLAWLLVSFFCVSGYARHMNEIERSKVNSIQRVFNLQSRL